MEYILGPKARGACVFCGLCHASVEARRERLVLVCTPHASVILNRYPFAAGHLLVLPHAHVSSLSELEPGAHDALFRLVRESVARLERAVRPQGLNVGLNLGASAGAGIAEHLHVHVVPRWDGDTNFMPVLADTRVVPQALADTRAHLEPFFADLADLEELDGPRVAASSGEP
jgi:ATP adenylyltransferase